MMRKAPTCALAFVLVIVALSACAHAPSPEPAVHPAAVAGGAAGHNAAPVCGDSPPVYEADVRPILATRCFKCHAGDGVAADEHDFSHVETLRAQRAALVGEISSCAMPPSSEPPLQAREASVLLAWASCGAR